MRIAVIDDHPLVWEGIRAILESDMSLVGCASNGRDAEKLVLEKRPDIVLVDLRLPGEYGLNIVVKLRALVPDSRFMVLSTFADKADVDRAVTVGVDGYLLKDALPDEMLVALRNVYRGKPYFHSAVTEAIVRYHRAQKDPLLTLSERERDVVSALSRGLSNREIGSLLCVTENTVKKHISSILEKLQLKDRTQVALYAVTHGSEGLAQPFSRAI